MDAEHRKLIVKEIERWRRGRLLPEQYCDFLLNLYSDHQESQDKSSASFGSGSALVQISLKVWLFVMATIGLISLFALNFNSFPLPLQIAVTVLIIATCFMIGGLNRERSPLISHLSFGAGSILLLFVGYYMMNQHEASAGAIVTYITLCCIVWMVLGVMVRLQVLHLVGWVILEMIYGWLLYSNMDGWNWAALQMGWVPVSVVLIWLGWFFHFKNKEAATVLLVAGGLAWFGPEAFGLLLTDVAPHVLQLSLMAKLVTAGIALYATRKKWTEWVT